MNLTDWISLWEQDESLRPQGMRLVQNTPIPGFTITVDLLSGFYIDHHRLPDLVAAALIGWAAEEWLPHQIEGGDIVQQPTTDGWVVELWQQEDDDPEGKMLVLQVEAPTRLEALHAAVSAVMEQRK